MSNNPDNDKFSSGKGYPIFPGKGGAIIKGTGSSDLKVPQLISASKITNAKAQIITQPLSLMRPTTQIVSQGMSSQLVSGGQATVVGASGVTTAAHLQGAQIISQGTQGGGPIVGQTTVRSMPTTAVRVLSSLSLPPMPLQQHAHLATSGANLASRPQNTIAGQTSVATKQLTTSYHVPRGPAAVASLAVPRGTAAPRAPTPSPAPSWSSGTPQCYVPRPPRPPTLQVTQRPALRQVTAQVSTATVVARAVRPANALSPQRTPPPQGMQTINPVRTTAPKVVPLVQRNYPAKVVGVATLGGTLGVKSAMPPRTTGGTYYYEVSSGMAPQAPAVSVAASSAPSSVPATLALAPQPTQSVAGSLPQQSLGGSVMSSSHVNSFVGAIEISSNDLGRAPSSPGGPQRPSILRKRDNETSPLKWSAPPPPPVTSPPPSPGGSTTVSAASSPGLDEDRDSPMPVPVQTLTQVASDLHSLAQAVTQPRDMHLHSLAQVSQTRDLHSLTQAASLSQEIHMQILNQSREMHPGMNRDIHGNQILNQSREIHLNQVINSSNHPIQILNQSRDIHSNQILNQSQNIHVNQSREIQPNQVLSSADTLSTQIISQGRDLHALSQAATQPRVSQPLNQVLAQGALPASQVVRTGSHSSGQSEPTPYNNCSPRKKPRKQLLPSERPRGGECEFPSEGGPAPPAPSPPAALSTTTAVVPAIEREKPRRRALLGAGWKCGWRATALHFTRPTDVRRREERRPSVVELAAQRHVLQKANGWKIHHLTAQMDDLVELEAGVLQQASEILSTLEAKPHADHHTICELLKGNIQRSRIVGEGVAEARSNVLRVFQHKSHVSDILARQADKRCFKKHRNQC